MTPPASATATAVTRRFGRAHALRGVDLALAPGRITGLLGRNGAGKSTLLSLLAGRRRPTSGAVRVAGGDPFRDPAAIARVCLVGDGGGDTDSDRLATRVSLLARLRPTFDPGFAHDLLDGFGVDRRARVQSLSRGERAAAAVALGLAARAPLTLFDESYLGLDVHTRQRFFDALLADYAAHPRTIVLSTHHVDEVAPLLEDVVVLDEGRVLHHELVDDLVGRAARLRGASDRVEALLAGWSGAGVGRRATRRLGPTTEAVVHGPGVDELRARAAAAGVEATAVTLQELFVHLTSPPDHVATSRPRTSSERTVA